MGIWQAGVAALLLLQLLIAAASAYSADLQNSDFEIPPTNIPKNSTNPFQVLNSTTNSIPGWSYQGNVKYVISSSKGNNAIYLGENGKINQTFKANEESNHYLLTFNLRPAQSNCTNPTSVTISVPDRSVVVSFNQKFAGKESSWQTHGVYLGIHGNGELINLSLEKYSNTTNTTECDVLLDSFILKNISNPINSSEDKMLLNGRLANVPVYLNNTKQNLLSNGGFEYGPAFPNNSVGGILIDAESNQTQSPINQWAILGTVKYITTNDNYLVPEGNAAVELVPGKSSGIQTTVTLQKGSKYHMEVFIGDANASCVGEYHVLIEAGSTVEHYVLGTLGMNPWEDVSFIITASSSVTPISIRSLTTTKTRKHGYCGPVIDRVLLLASYGLKLRVKILFVCLAFLVTLAQLIG